MVEVLRRATELKRQHADTILFFRLGDFYEVFADDARLVAQALHITLTSRPIGDSDRIPMAGVPYHSLDQAVARLLARGHKVAIAEQLTGATAQAGTDLEPDASETARFGRNEPLSATQLPLLF